MDSGTDIQVFRDRYTSLGTDIHADGTVIQVFGTDIHARGIVIHAFGINIHGEISTIAAGLLFFTPDFDQAVFRDGVAFDVVIFPQKIKRQNQFFLEIKCSCGF